MTLYIVNAYQNLMSWPISVSCSMGACHFYQNIRITIVEGFEYIKIFYFQDFHLCNNNNTLSNAKGEVIN